VSELSLPPTVFDDDLLDLTQWNRKLGIQELVGYLSFGFLRGPAIELFRSPIPVGDATLLCVADEDGDVSEVEKLGLGAQCLNVEDIRQA
jgi:hypothetical protein